MCDFHTNNELKNVKKTNRGNICIISKNKKKKENCAETAPF